VSTKIKGYRCIKDCSTTNDYARYMGIPTECKSGQDYFVVEDFYSFWVVFSPGQFCSFPRENFIDKAVLRDNHLLDLGI
jgi:hypothetical protein